MISNKTLGFLLLPLVPLSAIGIVGLVNRALPSAPALVECQHTREAPPPAKPPPTDLSEKAA